MTNSRKPRTSLATLWATFRLSVVGPLLAAPPRRGELKSTLQELASRQWRHPATGDPIQFKFPTIEQWFYLARAQRDNPIRVLGRKVRSDRGRFSSITAGVAKAIFDLHETYPWWSHWLHFKNLETLIRKDPSIGRMPSYATVRRFRNAHGLVKRALRSKKSRHGLREVLMRREDRELLQFEAEHVNALWHSDVHHGSRKVLISSGEWCKPYLLAIMDDHSRLICHAQWYLNETAENFVHGLCQAFLKRSVPCALMTDNGSAMIATDTTQGLERLGIQHETTLPRAPYQNGKQENFWAQLEGQLMAMLVHVEKLTLEHLNEATLAWIEQDYHRRKNSETGQPPLDRFLAGEDVGRRSPTFAELTRTFGTETTRSVRHSDGTVSVEGRRYQLPLEYRHLVRVPVRYVLWDLANVWLIDPASGSIICRILPVDPHRNADGRRRKRNRSAGSPTTPTTSPSPLTKSRRAPYLDELIHRQQSTGLPPAYLAKPEAPTESPTVSEDNREKEVEE